jgi:hypothetical protein
MARFAGGGPFPGTHHLERDEALMPEILRNVDHGHTAGADLAIEQITLAESCGETL